MQAETLELGLIEIAGEPEPEDQRWCDPGGPGGTMLGGDDLFGVGF